jgi:hypothetical protein
MARKRGSEQTRIYWCAQEEQHGSLYGFTLWNWIKPAAAASPQYGRRSDGRMDFLFASLFGLCICSSRASPFEQPPIKEYLDMGEEHCQYEFHVFGIVKAGA